MVPHRSPRDQGLKHSQAQVQAQAAPSRDGNTSSPAPEERTTTSSSSGGVATAPAEPNTPLNASQTQRNNGRSVVVVKKPVEIAKQPDADVPLPSAQGSINDFFVLPSSGKKVLQSFVYVRVERKDVLLAKKLVLGPQLEWKRRFMRVLCQTPGRERIEIYRTERRKGEHPSIKEVVHSFPLASLEFVQQQQLTQDEQLQFETFDYDSKKITQEYVFGHIRMLLYFQHRQSAKERPRSLTIEMCCTSSSERDQWVDFFVSYICKREREELLAYAPLPAPVVRMALYPQEGVQRFTSHFLSGARDDESKAKAKESNTFGNEGLAPISMNERTTSAITWDVLIAITVLDRKKVKVQCNSVGIFTIVELGEFAIASSEPDASHPDVFYVKPQDPSVAEVLGLYLNDDKMFQIRVLQDAKKFRQWLHQCFGLSRDGEMRSFHSPHGQSWFSERRHRSMDASSMDQNASFAVPPSPGMSPQSAEETSGVPFFQTSVERERAMNPDSLRRVRSVVLQKKNLHSVALRAISEPTSFAWNEMASLAYVEYAIIGSDPLPETKFTMRIIALDAKGSRFYVLSPPPINEIILEFGFQDVTYVTGYSDIFGDAGFTLHLFEHGIEVRVVPLWCEAKKMWCVAMRYFLVSDRLLRDTSSEDVNSRYLAGAGGLYLRATHVAEVVQATTVCGLCGEPKNGTPQCRVSGLQHYEYVQHVTQAIAECGSAMAALPMRDVAVPRDASELLRKCKEALRRAREAFDRATEV
jgi:hypothetical protein